MSVVEGQDLAFNSFGGDLNCLYYYFLNKETQNDSTYLGFVSTIQSVSYNPFIEMDDLMIVKSKFNTGKYGTPMGVSSSPYVYRISDNVEITKTLYSADANLNVSSKEPILNYYPYSYYMLYDGFNQPLIIKPQYLKNKKVEIKVRTNVNQNSKYILYANSYKGDYTGALEGIINDVPLLVPVTSSAYSQFWATSSSQFHQNFLNTSIENQTSYSHNTQNLEMQYKQSQVGNSVSAVTNAVGAIASLATLNVGGFANGIGGMVNTGVNAYFASKGYDLSKNQADEIKANSDYFNEANKMATLKDYKKSPRAVMSLGSDIGFSKMKNDNAIRLYDVSLEMSVIQKLEKFYHKYGYPLNKYVNGFAIGQIRENFNFVKMGYCDVFGAKIPKDDLEIIKTVLETGITFWNVENGVRIGDYSVTNNERS